MATLASSPQALVVAVSAPTLELPSPRPCSLRSTLAIPSSSPSFSSLHRHSLHLHSSEGSLVSRASLGPFPVPEHVFGSSKGLFDLTKPSQRVHVQAVEKELAPSLQKTTFHYLIANAKFMLDDEEHFQEQMQEKLRLYGERKMEQDFWIVIEPQFLEQTPDVAKRVGRPAVALVSTDKVWITFMKLRLDRVLKGEISVDSPKEALTGNLTSVKFERPEKWIAPYPKYEGDWWTPFLYKEK